MKIRFIGGGWFLQVTWLYAFYLLIGDNLLLVYPQFEYKGNFHKYGLYRDTWVQMLLQIRPLLRLGSKCYYGWDLHYTWVQMLLQIRPLLHLGPVITLVPSTKLLQHSLFSLRSTKTQANVQKSEVRCTRMWKACSAIIFSPASFLSCLFSLLPFEKQSHMLWKKW